MMTNNRSVLLISAIALILLALVPTVSANTIIYDEDLYEYIETSTSDVVLASDGITWTQATASAEWSERERHTSVVYDGKMWVMGGVAESLKNDVWWSTDGITWTRATASAGWSGRCGHTSLVYDGKMWVMGGYDESYKNDVWWSTDGITWTRATASAGWSPRDDHTSVVYDNKMWVIGGYDGSRKNDVWWSTDGITWTRATENAGWSERYRHTSVVYDNKMWVIGGYDGSRKNDVWWSTDGITWTRATASAGWSPRDDHTSVVYDNKMWVIGGYEPLKNDVWWSTDGITWTQATASAEWSERERHTSVVYDGKMWVMGGNDISRKNDVWWFTIGEAPPKERTVTVTMTDIDGIPISGFEVRAVNAVTGESYTVSTDSDVAYITLPMDRTATVPNPETGEYEEAPVGYYNFYGYKPGYKMVPDYAIRVNVLPEKYMPDIFCDILVAPDTENLRMGTVTMTDHNGTRISGFEVKAVNYYTDEVYTVSTDIDVAVITLPMDQTTTARHTETGEYAEVPVGYYTFYGYKPGYKMLNEDGIRVTVLPEEYQGSYQLCDIIVTPEDGYLTGRHKFQLRSLADNTILQTGTISAQSATSGEWYNGTVVNGLATLILPYDTSNPVSQYAGNYYVYGSSPGYLDSQFPAQITVTPATQEQIHTIYLTPIGGIPEPGYVNLRIQTISETGQGVPNANILIEGVEGAGWDFWESYNASSTGYLEVSVPANTTYDISVSAPGYSASSRRIEVFDVDPSLIQITLYLSGWPTPTQQPTTQPTGWPTGEPTPTSGIPGDDGSEGFLSEAIRGISRAFGVGFSTAKTIFGMLLALAIGFATAKQLRGGAAEFGLGLLGGTMLGVLVGLLPVWTIVVLLLVVGMYIGYRYVGGSNNG